MALQALRFVNTRMQDLHLELINLLQALEQQDASANVNSVKEAICIVADQLRQSADDEGKLDAAFAYYVAGYYVRASRNVAQASINDATHPAQLWLVRFIAKQFQDIEEHVYSIVEDDVYSDRRIANAVLHDGLSDSEAMNRMLIRRVAETMGRLMEFVQGGGETKLDDIKSTLQLCQRVACKAMEWRWWWWIECIRLVIVEFAANSLWLQLQSMKQENGASEIISRYIVANYARNNPVVELWRTQVESLVVINDPERRSFCLSIPTSGGKTRVAELAIIRFFLDYRDDPDAKCVYIAPLRKLANEVEQTLSPVLAAAFLDPGMVTSFYGGHEVDLVDRDHLAKARVLIVTPEKLDGMLRHDPHLRTQIRLVVADEGHMIGDDSDRGYRYRMVLERLIYTLRISPVASESIKPRFLFVSGVLPNASEFAGLIAGDSSCVVHINWRPLDEPLLTRWEWNGNQLIPSDNQLAPPILFNVPGCESHNKFEEAIVRAAFARALSSPTLVFSASKKAIESESLLELLQCLLDQQPLLTNDAPPSDLLKLDSLKRYYFLLERGVAIHHGGLALSLRNETETRIYDGRIRLLFASPTLAQGVNIPYDTVLVYRLQHYPGNAIHDATFWNVVGRVGRPIPQNSQDANRLRPPQVIFLNNKASNATQEDRRDARIGKELVSRQKQYRVASPFLQFLNQLRREWEQTTGQSVAELINTLAERPDLQWIANDKPRMSLSAFLRQLDEHLIALAEESCEEADNWLQARSGDVVNLLLQATTIEEGDLDFIRDAVLARSKFIIMHIPKSRRHQDYLLGLPLADCEKIRANQESLLTWYQGCADIFSRRLESGVEHLVQILDFVLDLSICPKEWRRGKIKPFPLLGHTVQTFWKSWLEGENTRVVASILNQTNPGVDFDKYREDMLQGTLAWGLSAICKFLEDIARDKGLSLTRDLEFLPSLVKYGVPGKLHCYLVRLNISREAATKIANLYADELESNGALTIDMVQSEFVHAELAIGSLTEEDMTSLGLSRADTERIKEMNTRISP